MLRDFPLIIADESVDGRIIRSLIDAGFRVYSVIIETPGIADTEVIDIAIAANGFIVTEDKDFGDELVYKETNHVGSLLLRISDLIIDDRIHLVIDTLTQHGLKMKDCFSVLTAKKLRVRKYE